MIDAQYGEASKAGHGCGDTLSGYGDGGGSNTMRFGPTTGAGYAWSSGSVGEGDGSSPEPRVVHTIEMPDAWYRR